MNVSVTNDTKDAHRCGFYVWGCVDLSVVGEVEIDDGKSWGFLLNFRARND